MLVGADDLMVLHEDFAGHPTEAHKLSENMRPLQILHYAQKALDLDPDDVLFLVTFAREGQSRDKAFVQKALYCHHF